MIKEEKITPGGMQEIFRSPATTIPFIIVACHEALRAFKLGLGEEDILSWSQTSEDNKKATEVVVMSHLKALEQGKKPDMAFSHNAWMQNKLNSGWKYGSVTDKANKIHSSLVDFDKLPRNEQLKDKIFVDVVESFCLELMKHD